MAVGEFNLYGVVTKRSADASLLDASATPSSFDPYFFMPGMTMALDNRTIAVVPNEGGKIVLVDAVSFSVREVNVTTDANTACFPNSTPKYVRPVFSGNRLVVNGWVLNDREDSGPSTGTINLQESGTCSILVDSGAAHFQPATKMLPTGWYGFLSDLFPAGSVFYIVGILPRSSPETPNSVDSTQTYGVFEFDTATLAMKANKTYVIPAPNGERGGYLLSLVPPS
jgi:hypothetical protein